MHEANDDVEPSDAREEGDGARTVLDAIGQRTGGVPKILLRDEDSAHATSPVIDASATAAVRPAQGSRHYQVLGKIAEGGMGVVFKGHDTDLGRDVAMKVLLERHADKPAVMQRFVEEAQIGGQLQHPGIVPVYDLGLMADDRPFFTMKLVKGRTLAALMSERRDDPGERRRFLKIFEQVCETMAYAHSRRVVHRDLKPSNIMVGAFGEVQVVDWGLGKVLSDGGVEDERAAKRALTDVSVIETLRSTGSSTGSESLVGSVMGTPMYMSPEQARGDVDRLDERTDVFGLGAILCEILTGKPPYVGEEDAIVVEAARAMQDGMRGRLAASGVDAFLVDLVERCLAPNQAVRPRSAGVLVSELAKWLADQEQRARDAEVAEARAEEESKRRRVTVTFAGTIVAALLAGSWFWQEREREVAERRAAVVDEVDQIISEAQLARGSGDLDGALMGVELASSVVDASPDAPAELATRTRDLIDELRREIASAEESAALDARRATLMEQLDRFMMRSLIPTDSLRMFEQYEALHAMFADAGYAITPLGDIAEHAAALRTLGNPELVGGVLDLWTLAALDIRGFGDEHRWWGELASAVDPDPTRIEVRRVVREDDAEAFAALAASEEAASTWSSMTALTFADSVRFLGYGSIDMRPLLRAVSRRYPEDARLHGQIAILDLWDARPFDFERGLFHASAAYSAAPDSPPMVTLQARALAFAGIYDEAVHLACRAYETMSWSMLDNSRSASFILEPLIGAPPELRAKFRAVLVERFPDSLKLRGDLGWDLVAGAGASDADIERGRKMSLEVMAEGGESSALWNTVAVASWHLDEVEDALAAADRSLELSDADYESDYLVRALALDALGRRSDALEALEASRNAGDPVRDPAELRLAELAAERLGTP